MVSSAAAAPGAGSAPLRASPLWAVMAFTFFNSLGGGVVTTGFAFLADSAYGFTPARNYGLGLLQGIVYIVGALAVGPVLAGAIARVRWLSTRLALAMIMAILAALCALPWLVRRFSEDPAAGAWTLWLLIGGYSALTGILWPITESYMSGGRSGRTLRSATGVFNVVWSSALVAAYWVMGPLKQHHSLELVVGIGAVHLACIGLLPALSANPAHHRSAGGGADCLPDAYPRLLSVFRLQLVTSYMVFSALTPFLPKACKVLDLPDHWQTPIAATWLLTRVLTFATLERWHGWHGRWATAGAGAAALIVGFVATVLSTTIAQFAGAIAGTLALILGLALFGVGMGIIYCAAIYYALAVGNAQVDAGGKHEALIGLGYGAGPVCGLLAIALARGGFLAEGPMYTLTGGQFEVLMLILVAGLALAVMAAALRAARGHARRV